MVLDLVAEREQLHSLVDRLDVRQVHAMRGLLETLIPNAGPANDGIDWEDEEISPEEEAGVALARESLKRNGGIPLEEVIAEFGLTMADFERMRETPLPPDAFER